MCLSCKSESDVSSMKNERVKERNNILLTMEILGYLVFLLSRYVEFLWGNVLLDGWKLESYVRVKGLICNCIMK